MRLLILVFLFFNFEFGISQKILNKNAQLFITSDFSIQRMDGFWNVGLKKRMNYFELGMALGIGIEKTIFQRHFSGHMEFYSFYNLIQQELKRKKGIIFGPGILLSGTNFKMSSPFMYGDIFVGYQFCFGQKIKLLNQGGYGLMFESFSGNNGKVLNSAYNYFFKIGISYAIY
jgi:hypothetical protein